jgi:hypothetical protein
MIGIFANPYTKAFIKILDEITLENGKSSWLEKTPEHLGQINYIERWVQRAKFIHIIRNGDDVVASLYEVAQKYPLLSSTDRGNTWQEIPLIKETYMMSVTAVSPAGKSWLKLASGSAVYGEDAYIEAVAISPDYQNDGTVIVSVRGKGLFKTVDGGKTFTPIGKDLLKNNYSFSNMREFDAVSIPIKFSPAYALDKTIYGYSGEQILSSEDGGYTWETLALPSFLPPPEFTTYNLPKENYFPRRIRSLFAAIASLLTYILTGYLGLEKILPFGKLPIRVVSALAAFLVVFILAGIPSRGA